ncbi:MAG: nitroreductase family protein [Bacteroidales bacterium]|nr:nitroreductase family protein [Bacteroidales bacterium]
MADNYLEKRYEEVFGRDGAGRKSAPHRPSLDTLLLRNRSFRGYDKDYVVHRRQLDAMIAVNPKVASSINLQRLRFRPVVKGPEADAVGRHIRMGRGLPELHLPFPGTEPEAFIVVCSTVPENPGIDIDLGISLQSMLLKAVEMGLGGLIIRNFDREPVREALGLPFEPVAVLAVGKPAERIELVPVHEGDNLGYYRKDGTHYVPKLTAEDLTLK